MYFFITKHAKLDGTYQINQIPNIWCIDGGGDEDQVIRKVSVTTFFDNVAERFDHDYKYIVVCVTHMEATLFRCEGANDTIDQVYNRRHNRVGCWR